MSNPYEAASKDCKISTDETDECDEMHSRVIYNRSQGAQQLDGLLSDPKFIVENEPSEGLFMIVAKCTYHKQLAFDVKNVRGGGWWTLDREQNIFTLNGESHDFGRASMDDIKQCVQSKRVFSSYSQIRNLTDEFTFKYKFEDGEIFNISSNQ